MHGAPQMTRASSTPRQSLSFAGYTAEQILFGGELRWRISYENGGCHMADLTEEAMLDEMIRLRAAQEHS